MRWVYRLKISGVIRYFAGLTLMYRYVIITASYRIIYERLSNGGECHITGTEKYPVIATYRAIDLIINYAATIRKEL